MGLSNVMSLKNGTAGWTLAGFELERGADRTDLPQPTAANRNVAEAYATRIMEEDAVSRIGIDQLQCRPDTECVYLVDVRTRSEYLEGHIPGFWWFPGGQAVQRADDVVAVRSAEIVFCCDGLVRAAVTASWFRQMGFPRVSVLDGGIGAWRARGLPLSLGPDEPPVFGLDEALADTRIARLSPIELAQSDGSTVLSVETSRQFARGHVPGARWLSRSWLELRIDTFVPELSAPVVVTDSDGRSAALAALTLVELGYRDVGRLDGGMRAWRAAGLPVEQGLSGVMQPPDDVVPSGLERSAAETIEYLRWETSLVH
jgi:rhodanese-related sulfurtransferase